MYTLFLYGGVKCFIRPNINFTWFYDKVNSMYLFIHNNMFTKEIKENKERIK